VGAGIQDSVQKNRRVPLAALKHISIPSSGLPGMWALHKGLRGDGGDHSRASMPRARARKRTCAAGDSAPLDPAALQDPKRMVPSACPISLPLQSWHRAQGFHSPGGSVRRGSSGRASYGI